MTKVIPIAQVNKATGKSGRSLQDACDASACERVILNKMCSSLLTPENRRRFRAFPEGYCREYGLSLEQIHAVTDLDIQQLLKLGCNIPNMERLTSIYGLDVLTLCMEQTGKALDDVRRLLET